MSSKKAETLLESPKRQRLDEAGAAGATWVESTTLAFPEGLPMEFAYHEPALYVRECYPKYYRTILRLLATKWVEAVTVTGTPGIGKSIFFAYFLQRYSFENPLITIITASFAAKDTASVMMMVAVWRGGTVVGQASNSAAKMEVLIEKTEGHIADLVKEDLERGTKQNRLIYLYDGPPNICPVGAQMVCFTSPNETWFKALKKSRYRPKLMMPLWDLKELQTAAEELNLTMDEPLELAGALDSEEKLSHAAADDVMVVDLIRQRFHSFGGVARECLATDETFVKERQHMIQTTIEKFEEIDYLRKVLDRTEAGSTTHHCICHYVPNPKHPMKGYTIAEPTTFVKRLLMECLSRVRAEKWTTIIDYLRDAKAAASFRRTLFEISVHEELNSDYSFRARRLGEDNALLFECEKSTPTKTGEFYCYFDNDFSASVLKSGPYHVPSAKNFVSIDSFYYPKQQAVGKTLNDQGQLWLFQMTAAQQRRRAGAHFGAVGTFLHLNKCYYLQ